MGITNSRGYNVLQIANWFHSLPHLNYTLKQISNEFDPQNSSYLISLSFFVGIPIAIMLIVLVLYIILTICLCFCCTDRQKDESIRIECKVFLFLFGLFCGLSFTCGLYGDWQIYKGVKEVQNSSEDAIDWIKSIISLSSRIYDTLKVEQTIRDLKENMNELKSLAPNQYESQFEEYFGYSDQILSHMTRADREVKNANKTINDYELNYEDIPHYIHKFGTIFCIITLLVLLFLAIIGLVFTSVIFFRLVLICFTVLAIISFILSSILMGTTFGISVGISDFCFDIKPWIRSKINNEDINNYLIDCVSDNKVHQYLNIAEQSINKANHTHQELKNGLKNILDKICTKPSFCPGAINDNIDSIIIPINHNNINLNNTIDKICNQSNCREDMIDKFDPNLNPSIDNICNKTICKEGVTERIDNNLNEINSKIKQILALINELLKEGKCDRINKVLNRTLDTICTDILKGIVYILFNTTTASFCFAILFFSSTIALC